MLVDASLILKERDAKKYSDIIKQYTTYQGQYYERGVLELQKKIDDIYTDKKGRVFWNLDREDKKYYASISTNLDVIAQAKIY